MNLPLSIPGVVDALIASTPEMSQSEPNNFQTASRAIQNLEQPLYLLDPAGRTLAFCPALRAEDLGNAAFKCAYGLKYALYAGAMANAISSEALVIAMGKAGMMASFGAGGCLPARIEAAIARIKQELPEGPYLFNLINSPFEPSLEQKTAGLYLQHGIRQIEASAYLNVTRSLVHYRAAGLRQNPDGSPRIGNRIIAKLSRKEVAAKFLKPAPDDVLAQLVSEGLITQTQANLAAMVPMADDITVEADSGGHTDNRPLVGLLPAMIRVRDEMRQKYGYPNLVRIGAAGGIATPESALAALMMGADYLVTGSINQGCVEAGASEHTRKLLAQMESTDVAMAPASDMFEMGVKVQVLKRGTMFAMRGQKLFEIYQRYDSIEEIPADEREKLEKTIFQRSLESVWEECLIFFSERDPGQIERARQKPKDRMALIFRWYLGLSSRWSSVGEKGREMDYQIWCGPAMGAFNDWVRGSFLEPVEQRSAPVAAGQILRGAAYLYRLRILTAHGVQIAPGGWQFRPSSD